MSDGNISSFLRMTGLSDGAGDNDNSTRNGNYNQRLQNRRNHYIKTGYKAHKGINIDPETGEVLDFVPRSGVKNPYKVASYKRSNSFNLQSLSRNIPQPKTILNLVLVGAIGYGGYILYKKILSPLTNSSFDDKKDTAEKNNSKSYVDGTSSDISVNNANQSSLAKLGYKVSTTHVSSANTLHGLLNSSWVNEDQVVKIILTMQVPTFQLVSIAYGVRSLPAYCTSILNIFKAYKSANSLDGSLKKHLTNVLSSTNQSKISKYLSAI